ncbi:G5 domain-containing protein [Micromonospora sp. DPT]|uniref:G5 domain-containing protein n=1 Tax=Micromonospora sp. DPT TaxID=3142975 RepID=UPI0032095098
MDRSVQRDRHRSDGAALADALLVPVLCCGVPGIVALVSPTGSDKDATSPPAPTIQAADAPSTAAEAGLAATPPAPSPTAVPPTAAAPVVETRTVTETQKIAYQTRTVNDSSLPKGTRKVTTRGVAGVKTLTYQVTLTDGVQTARKLVRSQVTKTPVTQVVRVGTKVTQQCDPNYSGACVPIASDVDCAGGSGNGPAYVEGPVRVIGRDIYDLDGNNNDGIGCEN